MRQTYEYCNCPATSYSCSITPHARRWRREWILRFKLCLLRMHVRTYASIEQAHPRAHHTRPQYSCRYVDQAREILHCLTNCFFILLYRSGTIYEQEVLLKPEKYYKCSSSTIYLYRRNELLETLKSSLSFIIFSLTMATDTPISNLVCRSCARYKYYSCPFTVYSYLEVRNSYRKDALFLIL